LPRKQAAGSTAAEVLEAIWRKKQQLERRALGIETPEDEEARKTALHAAVKEYLEPSRRSRTRTPKSSGVCGTRRNYLPHVGVNSA